MKIEKFKELLNELKNCSDIDNKNIDKDIMETLSLYQNLIEIVSTELYRLHKTNLKYDIIYQSLYHKYKTQYDYNLSVNEIKMYVESDDKISDLRKEKKMLEYQISIIEKYIDMLRNKQFQIKNIIDWKKYQTAVI